MGKERFKIGDQLKEVSWPLCPVKVLTITEVMECRRYMTKESGTYTHDCLSKNFELVTRQYDPKTAMHGDVYSIDEDKGSHEIVILPNTATFRHPSEKGILFSASDATGNYIDGRVKVSGYRFGKFLYNVFDREKESEGEPVQIGIDLAKGKDESVISTFKIVLEDEKEAIMPVTITTTTTFPKGSAPDVVKIAGGNIESFNDDKMVELIRSANTEIETLTADAKDSKSKHIANKLAEAKAIRGELVRLLDTRAEA